MVVFRRVGFIGVIRRLGTIGVLDPLEQLAEIARRLALLRFLAGVADQRAAFLRVGGRVLADEFGQRGVVGEQLLAGALDPVHARRFGLVDAVVRAQRGAQRGGFVFVQRAHYAAHVLDLAALALMVGDAACFAHRV